MPRSTRSAATFAQALRAVERAEANAAKAARRETLRRIQPMKRKLPPRPTISEWNTDKSGSAIGVFRALVLDIAEGKLYFLDRRYMGPADDPEITRAVPLEEPRHVSSARSRLVEILGKNPCFLLGSEEADCQR